MQRIAQRWEVSLEDLKRWNPDADDVNEGDVLYVFVPEGTKAKDLPPIRKPRTSARRARPSSRCKAQSTRVKEGEIVTAVGLSQAQIQRAVQPRLHRASACLPPHLHGTYEMIVEVKVGCDGRVSNTYTLAPGALSPKVTACVEGVFRYTRFPKHDMPDGQSFQYPLVFTQ